MMTFYQKQSMSKVMLFAAGMAGVAALKRSAREAIPDLIHFAREASPDLIHFAPNDDDYAVALAKLPDPKILRPTDSNVQVVLNVRPSGITFEVTVESDLIRGSLQIEKTFVDWKQMINDYASNQQTFFRFEENQYKYFDIPHEATTSNAYKLVLYLFGQDLPDSYYNFWWARRSESALKFTYDMYFMAHVFARSVFEEKKPTPGLLTTEISAQIAAGQKDALQVFFEALFDVDPAQMELNRFARLDIDHIANEEAGKQIVGSNALNTPNDDQMKNDKIMIK